MNQNVAQLKRCFRQSFLAELELSLDKLFQSADESVLRLACESSTNKEQNRFFEAAQALRIVRRDIKHVFIQLLTGEADHFAVDEQHLQSLEGLVNVSLDDHGWENAGSSLEKRLQQIDSGLHSPFTAKHFIACFLRSLASVNFDVHIKMLVLRLFEAQTFSKLEQFIHLANSALLAQGILPELIEKPDIKDSVDEIIHATLGSKQEEVDKPSLLEQALADLQADEYELLELHLSADYILQASLPKVRDYIDELPYSDELPSSADFTKEDIESTAVVGRLFAVLLESDALPVQVRFLLSKLQLPFTRIALVEESFLSSHSHPARTLLSQLAELSLSWSAEDKESLLKDELYIHIKHLIQTLYEAERIQHLPFADLLFELFAFSEERRQYSLTLANQWEETANAAESSDQSREQVDKLLKQKTNALELPTAVTRILFDGWSHVLYMQAISYGFNSDEWRGAVNVVDDLLATVKPVDHYENREAFLSLLPSLLHQLRIGMYVIELSSTLIHQFLADLEAVHKSMIVNITDSGELADYEGSALSQGECPSALDVMRIMQNNTESQVLKPQALVQSELEEAQEKDTAELDLQLDNEGLQLTQELETVADAAETLLQMPDNMKLLEVLGQGVWLIWHKPDQQLRCQIAAHIKHAKKYILTDRGGRKIADIDELEMADMLANGVIELAESGHVFEKALESVIGGIRDSR